MGLITVRAQWRSDEQAIRCPDEHLVYVFGGLTETII